LKLWGLLAQIVLLELYGMSQILSGTLLTQKGNGGILALWNENKFKMESVEFGGQRVAIFGFHVATMHHYAIMGVYAETSVAERSILWDELIILKLAVHVPLFIVGDFNDTLNVCERSSR